MTLLPAFLSHRVPTQTIDFGAFVSRVIVRWITVERPSLRSDTRIR